MVKEHKEQNWLITASLVILAVVALATALIYTRAVMIPFVVALFTGMMAGLGSMMGRY